MDGAVIIGLLIMASGEISEGRWESVGAQGLNYECLEDSPGPKVLALLAVVRHVELSEGGEVGGLCVAYLRWGGLEALHPHNMEWSGPRGPNISNPVGGKLLSSARKTMKGRYGLL